MEEINVTLIKNQYYDLLKKVNRLKPFLDMLYTDYRLKMDRNIQFTYAVDFHEIWNYAEPLAPYYAYGAGKRTEKAYDELLENVQIKQFARAELFFAPGQTVLLPPYVIELNNKVSRVKNRILNEGGQGHADSLRKLEKIARSNKEMREAVETIQGKGKIPSALLNKVQHLLETEVRNLLFLISDISSEGVSMIQDLLLGEKPIILMASTKWPQFIEMIQETMTRLPSEWYARFQMARPNPDSSASNFYDSKAIDLILELNQHLMEKQEVVVIVSDAPTMRHVVDKDYTPKEGEKRNYISTKTGGTCVKVDGFDLLIPIFRPIEMFYYLAILRGNTDLATLENIKSELLRIDQLSILGEAIEKLTIPCPDCLARGETDKCSFSDDCNNLSIRKQLSDHSDYFDKYTKILLAENRFSTLSPAWEKIAKREDEFRAKLGEGTLKLIKYLSSPQQDLENGFKAKKEDLQDKMEAEQLKALLLITDLTSDTFQQDISGSLMKITRLRYRIRFYDTEIALLLNQLEQLREESSDVREMSQIIKRLINQAYEKNINSEKPFDSKKLLLWAVLLLCHRLGDQAIGLINRVLPDVKDKYKPEFLYLRALANYENKQYKQVITECQKAIAEFTTESRFYNLCGLAISRLLETSDSTEYSWSNAIEYVNQAYTLVTMFHEEPSLKSTIVNNLAYFYYCKGEPDDIKRALNYIDDLQLLTPSLEGMPEYLNTKGCVFKAYAIQAVDADTKLLYKGRALTDLSHAYELAQKKIVDPGEVAEYKKDLDMADEQLRFIDQLIR